MSPLATTVKVDSTPNAYIMSHEEFHVSPYPDKISYYLLLTDIPEDKDVVLYFIYMSLGSTNSCYSETATSRLRIITGSNIEAVCGDEGYTPPPMLISTASIDAISLNFLAENSYFGFLIQYQRKF